MPEFKETLKSIDIFGQPFHFTTFGKKLYKSLIGSFFTIICSVVIVIFTFLFGRDFYYRENPILIQELKTPDTYPPAFELSHDNFFFVWRITNSSELREDHDTHIEVNFNHFYSELDSEVLIDTPLSYKLCSDVNVTNPLMSTLGRSDWFCIDWESHRNLTFGGYWDDAFIAYIAMSVSTCRKGVCTPLKDMKEFLGKTQYIDMFVADSSFAPNDIEDPLKPKIRNYYAPIDFNLRKMDRIYFKRTVLTDDKGWILKDPIKTEISGYDKLVSDYFFYFDEDYELVGGQRSLYEMTFYQAKPFNNISRKYMKIQDVGAIVGGLLKFVIVVGLVISKFFSKFIQSEDIMGMLFEDIPVKDLRVGENRRRTISFYRSNSVMPRNQKNDTDMKTKRNNAGLSINNPTENNNGTKNFLNEKSNNAEMSGINLNAVGGNVINNFVNASERRNMNQFVEEEDRNKACEPKLKDNVISPGSKNEKFQNAVEILKRRNEVTVDFGLKFSIKNAICCKQCKKNGPKEKKFVMATDYCAQIFDIEKYTELLRQFEGFKLLILNKNQSGALKYLKKPNLSNPEELSGSGKVIPEELMSAMDYFKMKLTNPDFTRNDEELLNMVDPELLKNIIKE